MDLQPSRQPPTQAFHSLSLSCTINKYHAYAFSFLLILLTTLIFSHLLVPFDPQLLLGVNLWHPQPTAHQKQTWAPCDYSNGRWVFDESYSLGKYTEKCPFLDPGFRCHQNGRLDQGFWKWRWQPHGCDLPRFDASDLLARSEDGRIVFAGDSIARNQWESLLCMLAEGTSDLSTIYEVNGRPITKHKGYLSIRFQQHNLTVEYYRVPFLVRTGPPQLNSSGRVRSAITVDKLHRFSDRWIGADVLIFSGGHWWNDDKTVKVGAYFEERGAINMTMDPMEAFRRSLTTWKSWVIHNLDPQTTHIFFRGYSSVHFRNRKWDQGGTCKDSTAPETDITQLQAEPLFNQYISGIVKEMKAAKRKVKYLNITYQTEFRADGHPSIHREPGTPLPIIEDCSHWCLPGVPDTWNEILYAHLLSDGFRTNL